MQTKENSILKIAKITTSKGLKGEVKLLALTNYPDDLLRVKSFLLEDKTRINVKKIKRQNKSIVAKFKDIDSIEDAKNILGKFLYLDEKAMGEFFQKDEYLISELIGFGIFDEEMNDLGKVVSIIDMPRNQVLEISKNSKKWLLPFIKEFVLEVDQKNKQMKVKLIEGLVDEIWCDNSLSRYAQNC